MRKPHLTDLVLDARGLARFWARIDKNGPIPAACPELGSCWMWQGAKGVRCGDSCYGILMIRRKMVRAHRVAWVLENGPVHNELCVLHRCDNPACVNPVHLFLGTHEDNAHDRHAKGRTVHGRTLRGEQHWKAVLTVLQVRTMREKRASGVSADELALEFGVSPEQIGRICSGEQWQDAGGPLTERRELKGSGNPASKLKDDDVRAIRREHAAGTNGAVLGRRFGVTRQVIHSILKGQTWQHVL